SPGGDPRIRPGVGDAVHRGVRVSATVTRPVPREAQVGGPASHAPRKRRWTRFILPAYSGLVMFYLVLPILVMILYSFNNSGFKKVTFNWLGFTTEWYKRLFAIPDL